MKRIFFLPVGILVFGLFSLMVMGNCSSPAETKEVVESKVKTEETPEVVEEVELEPVVIEKATDLTATDFHETISKGVVLVDFWAAWCAPCRIQGPIVDEVAVEMGAKAKVTKLNVDHHNAISAEYSVRNIPTIILFKDGKEAKRFVGVQQKDFLMQQINQLL